MLRLHVRLDAERRRRLEELAEEGGMPMSDVVRGLIDEAYECTMLERRREAVSRLVALEVEDPPDVATLSRSWTGSPVMWKISGGLAPTRYNVPTLMPHGSNWIVSADTDFDRPNITPCRTRGMAR